MRLRYANGPKHGNRRANRLEHLNKLDKLKADAHEQTGINKYTETYTWTGKNTQTVKRLKHVN